MKTAALIPAWNNAEDIASVIKGCKGWADTVLVVDDGSTDRTAQLAKEAGAQVVVHPRNRGKGEGLRTGIVRLRGKADFIVMIDADMQYNPADAPDLLQPLMDGSADIVMGARNWSEVPLRHRLGNWVWRTEFNLLFGAKFSDTNCGFMAMTSAAAEKVRFHGGYIIESGILADAVRYGLKAENVPVKVTYRHPSKVPRGLRMVAGVLIFILTEGLRWRLRKR